MDLYKCGVSLVIEGRAFLTFVLVMNSFPGMERLKASGFRLYRKRDGVLLSPIMAVKGCVC